MFPFVLLQRTLTGDALIGEAEVAIPSEVMQGETHQHWYPLIGRQSNTQENLGDILLVMSFMVNIFILNFLKTKDR